MKTSVRGRGGVVALVMFCMFLGATLIAPVGAHVGNSVGHLWQDHLKGKVKQLVYTKSESDARYLSAADSSGLALAGGRFRENGNFDIYFNRFGGAPTVTHTQTGEYQIEFPGLNLSVNFNAIPTATILSGPGEIDVGSVEGAITVSTYDSAGVLSDKQFTLVVHPGS